MDLQEKINRIVNICNAGVCIEINDHANHHMSVKQAIETDTPPGIQEDMQEEVSEDVKIEMIKRNTMVCIHASPDIPVGKYMVYHYDLEKAVDEMMDVLTP